MKESFLVRMGKLASDRIINLKLYCTVNENVVLIFLLLGYMNQTKNGGTKSTLKYLFETVLYFCRVLAGSYGHKTTLRRLY